MSAADADQVLDDWLAMNRCSREQWEPFIRRKLEDAEGCIRTQTDCSEPPLWLVEIVAAYFAAECARLSVGQSTKWALLADLLHRSASARRGTYKRVASRAAESLDAEGFHP